MSLIKFSPKKREEKSRKHHAKAFVASCVFHGFLLCLILGLTYFYRSHIPLFKSGSKANGGTITLSTLVIVPTPPQPTPPPEQAIPVVAKQSIKPAKSHPPAHPAISHPSTATAQASSKPAAASSYAPGDNVLPHPPYPPEARDRRQTGTVMMSLQFDSRGNVVQAEVAQSSGVQLLDTFTRTFIRTHWHSLSYAGQTVTVPVRYTLENL
jgi:TonB family protein